MSVRDVWIGKHGFQTQRLALVREESPRYECAQEPQLSGFRAVARYLHGLLEDQPLECFGVLLLSSRHRVIGHVPLHVGTESRTAVSVAAVLRVALLGNAAAIIVYHNHPSGDPTPSIEDFAFSRRLLQCGEHLGVPLLDSIIIGSRPIEGAHDLSGFVSLKERGGW